MKFKPRYVFVVDYVHGYLIKKIYRAAISVLSVDYVRYVP